MIWRRKLLDFCGSAAGVAAALDASDAEIAVAGDLLSVELMATILDASTRQISL